MPFVLNFLLIQVKNTEFKVEGLENAVKVFRKYPTVVQSAGKFLDFSNQDESEELFVARLNLAKECCITT